MHLHLPKPLHGWREFAGEIGIIDAVRSISGVTRDYSSAVLLS